MIVGGYEMHLYCQRQTQEYDPSHQLERLPSGLDRFVPFPYEIVGQTASQCRARARRAGWRFVRDEDGRPDVLCPLCARRDRDRST